MCIWARAGSGVGADRPASAWRDGAEGHRHGQFRNLLQSGGEDEIQRGRRPPSLLLVRRIARASSKSVLKDRSELRDCVLGHRPDALGQPVCRPALAADDRQRQGGDRQGPRHRLADAAREGLHRRGRDPVFEQRRDDAAPARARLREGDGTRVGRQQGQTSKRASSGRWPIAQAASPTDKTYARNLQAAEMLEPMYKQMPNHPGIAHYIIHAYDVPALAPEGAARGARATPTSRRSCRTRSTCRRTRSRASATGRNRSTSNVKSADERREDQRHRRSDARARLHDLRLPADGHGCAGEGEHRPRDARSRP